MKTDQFVAALDSTISKADVREKIRMTREELSRVVEPLYKTASDFFRTKKFTAPEVLALNRSFKTFAGGPANETIVAMVAKGTKQVIDNLNAVEKLFDRSFAEESAALGFTYRKASLLQFLDAAGFYARYSRRVLSFILIEETAQYENSGTDVNDSITPADREYITKNLIAYAKTFDVVTIKEAELSKALASIPDLVVSADDHDNVVETTGENKLDPLRFGFIPTWANPFFFFGKMKVEREVARYKESKAELRSAELRILNLKKLADGKPDTLTQQRILEAEMEVADATAAIEKLERKWNG